MGFQYQEYTRSAIKADAIQLWVGKWRIDYLAFSSPANAHKPPLLVVGGAFQNFTSYKYCVERIYEDFPVILVELPSLGNNTHIAPALIMEDLADLLYEFTLQTCLQKIQLLGLSLGSAVASTFA